MVHVCTSLRYANQCYPSKIVWSFGKGRSNKIMDLTQATNRRNPRQARSKERVTAILQVVKTLIEENGINNLKVSDVAHRANTSPGSIYQYFKNKQSIIIALAEHYMDQIHAILDDNLEHLDSVDSLPKMLSKNFDDIHQLHVKESALRQIWFESIDPELNKLAMVDCHINTDRIYKRLLELGEPKDKDQLHKFILLMSLQFGVVMRLCFEEQDSTSYRDIFVQNVTRSIEDYF